MNAFDRLSWMWNTDRIGPDVFLTHFLLHFKPTAKWLCNKKFMRFGKGASFRPYAYAVCTSRISIGDNVIIRPGTMLYAGENDPGSIIIENDVLIGSGVHIYCDNHYFEDISKPISAQGYRQTSNVTIKKGSWVGACAIILPGVTIGENSVVGAGAVVTRSIPDRVVAAGNPARVIRQISGAT